MYASYEKYKRALFFLKMVIEVEGRCIHQTVLKALKKYILISLIVNGKLVHTQKWPEGYPPSVERRVKPYFELAKAFEKTDDDEELNRKIREYRHVFEVDGSSELVEILPKVKTKFLVKRLAYTYVNLSMEDLAKKTNLPSVEIAESLILEMVSFSKYPYLYTNIIILGRKGGDLCQD